MKIKQIKLGKVENGSKVGKLKLKPIHFQKIRTARQKCGLRGIDQHLARWSQVAGGAYVLGCYDDSIILHEYRFCTVAVGVSHA